MNPTRTVDASGTIRYHNAAGEPHHEDGPAVEYTDGTKHWYVNGKVHREDGPAIEFSNGDYQWYNNGERHYEGGPALCFIGKYEYWLNDKKYSKTAYDLVIAARKEGRQLVELKASVDQLAAIQQGAGVVIKGKQYKLVAVD